MLTHPQSISLGSSGITDRSGSSRDRGNEDASGARSTGPRDLPASVAAAVLMTMDYAGPEQPGPGPTCVSGCLPAHLCYFEGRDWHDDWTGTADGIWMTPIGGASVRFAPPSGFRELCDATTLLVAELKPEVRRLILLAHPTLEFDTVVDDHAAAPLLIGFGGRFGALVSEVWQELRESAATAHDRMALATERGMLEAVDR